ncbi:hypothetical protein K438DRAFT_1737998 [Mycena galopus ATCC 62051]|nr:hypothetical protein K438DRAFT_1737998 [Mycena galopus ATCC 62051]
MLTGGPYSNSQRSQQWHRDLQSMASLTAQRKLIVYKPSYCSPTPAANAGGSVTGTIYAPILRLPIEILTKIFALYSDAFPHAFGKPPYNFGTELDRLANVQLLTVSGVCGQWHHTVMETPTLWSTFELNGVLWSNSSCLEDMMALLAAALGRARNVPIELRIFGEHELPVPRRLFDLLAQHSRQWRTAEFVCSMENLDLSILKGRLPLLQKLEINLPRMPHAVDFLEGAPRLENLIVAGALLENIGNIPLKQLTRLGCERMTPMDVARVVSFASELPRGTHLHLSADTDCIAVDRNQRSAVGISPTIMAISRLSCRLTGYFRAGPSSQTLNRIFASLTLPNLGELWLTCAVYPDLVPEWPHTQFLELSERSEFHRCLKVLRIADLLISEGDLIAVLSSLQSLEHLEIADNQRSSFNSTNFLPTDNFLRAITIQAPDRYLIPRLRNLVFATRLRFTNNVFAAFIASRLEVCPSAVFHVEIRSLSNRKGILPCVYLPRLLHGIQTRGGCRLEYVLDGHLSLA